MSERIYPVSLEDAAKAIAGKRALILCHVNPDGDALGSATALLELIRLTGGDGKVVTPSHVPERLSFIVGDMETSYAEGEEADFDLVLSVATASPTQLGDLSHLADKVDISFDHHGSCTLYSPYVLYGGSAAAGIVVFDLFCELEKSGKVTGDVSAVLRRIYCAIASDTGSFKYSNADAEAFTVAAEIMKRLGAPSGGSAPIDGMTTSDISAALFDNVSKKDVFVRQIAYRNLRYVCDGQVALSSISAKEMSEAGLSMDDLGGMVDCVRGIDKTAVGIVLKQSAPDVWRGSSRANVDVDVSVPASKLSGGGHKRAAGFTVSNASSSDEAAAIVEKVFGEALEGCYE